MNDDPIFLNLDEAIKRMGDREIFLEISRYFASRLPEALEELALALKAGNTAEATRYAHSMKSNCSAMGADQLHEQCRALEGICRQGALDDARKLYAELMPRLLALRNTLLML